MNKRFGWRRTAGVLACAAAVYPLLAEADAGDRTVPPLPEILAAVETLHEGDIPADGSTTEGKTPLYVATYGSDAHSGLDIDFPKLHLRAAIQYANAHPDTPYVIYLRGGTHYDSVAYDYLEIQRGELYITAYPGEEAVLRPHFWPDLPTDWGEAHYFVSSGPYENITIANLTLQGFDEPFFFGSQYEEGPMRNLVIKGITATDFRKRFAEWGPVFFGTDYATRDYFDGPDSFDPDDPGIKYQIEGLILSDIVIGEAGLAVNIGDERDANVKGLRISGLELLNSPAGGNNTSLDGIAVVNSYKALIDSCVIEHTEGDGIDCKSLDVCIVNTLVHGTTRNGIKLWRGGELVNTIIHDCSAVADAALVVEAGYPFRMIHSVLMGATPGYAATYNYPSTSSAKVEVVNSVFSNLTHSFYLGTGDLRSAHSLYYATADGVYSGQTAAATVAQLNQLPNCGANLSADPLFADPAGFDFRVPGESPCRDAGTSAGVLLPSFDYLGNPRVMGAAPDIGPCEYSAEAPGADRDSDGLTNLDEDFDMDGMLDPGETDPADPDTDDNGASDLIERRSGSDPRDPASRPATVRVDFGPSTSVPTGYCADIGTAAGPRGYGWL